MMRLLGWSFLVALTLLQAVAHENKTNEDRGEKMVTEKSEVEKEDLVMALMLLGGIGFVVAQLYFVHHKDKDLRKYAWEVISSTMSIFSAVLLFQAFDGVLDWFIEDAGRTVVLVADFAHMIFWMIVLQLALSWEASHSKAAHGHKDFQAAARLLENPSEPMRKEETEALLAEHFSLLRASVKAWATVLGHITGFATINAWCSLQEEVPHHWWWLLLVTVGSFFFLYALYEVHDGTRERLMNFDGIRNAYEMLWDETTEETENDVMALVVSFLSCQFIRFMICGQLPNKEGLSEDEEGHAQHMSKLQCVLLAFVGVVFGVLHIMNVPRMIALKNRRISTWLVDIFAMVFAWCLYFSFFIFYTSYVFSLEQESVASVVTALTVTLVAVGLIFFLDKLEDLPETGAEIDESIRSFIFSLAILIGFSWERSFDGAVTSLAKTWKDNFLPPALLKLLLAALLAWLVLPAWKNYILKIVHRYEEEENDAVEFKFTGLEHDRLHREDMKEFQKKLIESLEEIGVPKFLQDHMKITLQKGSLIAHIRGSAPLLHYYSPIRVLKDKVFIEGQKLSVDFKNGTYVAEAHDVHPQEIEADEIIDEQKATYGTPLLRAAQQLQQKHGTNLDMKIKDLKRRLQDYQVMKSLEQSDEHGKVQSGSDAHHLESLRRQTDDMLREQLQEECRRRNSSEEELRQLQEQLHGAQARIATLEHHASRAPESGVLQDNRAEELEAQLYLANQRAADYELQIREHQDHIQKLQADHAPQLQQVQQVADQAQQQAMEHERRMQILQQQLEQAKLQESEQIRRVQEMERVHADTHSERRRLTEAHEETQQKLEAVLREHEIAQQEAAGHAARYQEAQQELATHGARYQEAAAETERAYAEKILELEQAIQERDAIIQARDEMISYRDEMISKQDRLQAATLPPDQQANPLLESVVAENNIFRNENTELRQRISELEGQLLHFQRQVGAMEDEITTIRKAPPVASVQPRPTRILRPMQGPTGIDADGFGYPGSPDRIPSPPLNAAEGVISPSQSLASPWTLAEAGTQAAQRPIVSRAHQPLSLARITPSTTGGYSLTMPTPSPVAVNTVSSSTRITQVQPTVSSYSTSYPVSSARGEYVAYAQPQQQQQQLQQQAYPHARGSRFFER